MGWVVNATPWPLYPRGKTRYPLYKRRGGPQGRSGRVLKISPPTGIRSPDCPVCSESLYRLPYPRPHHCAQYIKNYLVSLHFFFRAACANFSFLRAASLQSLTGCMRFLFNTCDRTTWSCFLDLLRQMQMKFLFVALNFGTLASYITDRNTVLRRFSSKHRAR